MIIVIIKTPFHLRQFINFIECGYNNQLLEKNYIFFISKYITKENLVYRFPTAKFIEIRDYEFRQIDFIKNPIIKFFEYRKFIYSLKIKSSRYINLCSDINIYLIIFSEKDVFTQIIISALKKQTKKINISAIDEGASYYNKNRIYDYFLKIIYPIVSLILFKFPYKYYRVLGTSTDINSVYVRWKNLLNYVSYKKKYYEIKTKEFDNSYVIKNTGKILIISSSLSEDRLLSKNDESNLLTQIFNIILKYNYTIYLKTHPLEYENKFEKYLNLYKINIIKNVEIAEDLDYFEYDYIINFGSAVVLDMMEKKYPSERIITIDKTGITKNCLIYRLTNSINVKELSSILKEYL